MSQNRTKESEISIEEAYEEAYEEIYSFILYQAKQGGIAPSHKSLLDKLRKDYIKVIRFILSNSNSEKTVIGLFLSQLKLLKEILERFPEGTFAKQINYIALIENITNNENKLLNPNLISSLENIKDNQTNLIFNNASSYVNLSAKDLQESNSVANYNPELLAEKIKISIGNITLFGSIIYTCLGLIENSRAALNNSNEIDRIPILKKLVTDYIVLGDNYFKLAKESLNLNELNINKGNSNINNNSNNSNINNNNSSNSNINNNNSSNSDINNNNSSNSKSGLNFDNVMQHLGVSLYNFDNVIENLGVSIYSFEQAIDVLETADLPEIELLTRLSECQSKLMEALEERAECYSLEFDDNNLYEEDLEKISTLELRQTATVEALQAFYNTTTKPSALGVFSKKHDKDDSDLDENDSVKKDKKPRKD